MVVDNHGCYVYSVVVTRDTDNQTAAGRNPERTNLHMGRGFSELLSAMATAERRTKKTVTEAAIALYRREKHPELRINGGPGIDQPVSD